MFRLVDFGLEDATKERKETEITIFGILEKPAPLDNYKSKRRQVDLILSGRRGKLRIRKEEGPSRTTYQAVMKKHNTQKDIKINSTTEIVNNVDEVFFNAFEEIAEIKLVKDRYVYHSEEVIVNIIRGDDKREQVKLPKVNYEVDLFYDKDDNILDMIKIDIEIDHINEYLTENGYLPEDESITIMVSLKPLPFTVLKPFIANDYISEARKNLIKSLIEKQANHLYESEDMAEQTVDESGDQGEYTEAEDEEEVSTDEETSGEEDEEVSEDMDQSEPPSV